MLSLARSAYRCVLMSGLALSLGGCAANISPEFYQQLSGKLAAAGHLRTDLAPLDAPFEAADLTRTFGNIAFSYEFHFDGNRIVNAPLERPLKRWRGQVRYQLTGDAVTHGDVEEVANFTQRLSRLTGLLFEPAGAHRPDMLISIAGKTGRPAISRLLGKMGLPVHRNRYELWRRTSEWLCGATLSSDRAEPSRLVFAHIFIGGEITGTLRRGCLHEEIAQSLGLTNDSDLARPSIFNDDHEFAALTVHDSLLLRALYDRRLKQGMDKTTAMPIVRRIFTEMLQIGLRDTMRLAGLSGPATAKAL